VGALFAVIGNKYIVEASLPESTTFTLVDSLHAITMFFVLLIITSNTLSLKYAKNNKPQISKKMDRFFSWTIIILYLIINIAFIYAAIIK
jgi:heme A synthase